MAPRTLLCILSVTTAVLTATATAAFAAPEPAPEPECAGLHLLIANGIGEAAPHTLPDQDTGFGASIAVPAQLAANRDEPLLSRSYLAYGASDPYAQSVASGTTNATTFLADQVERCPNQRVFLVGIQQGAQVMSTLASDIGTGRGPLPADRVAGVALFSDPGRTAGAPIFLGGRSSPGQLPGVTKSSVAQKIRINAAAPADGGGLSVSATPRSYGSLSARVASFCVHGDLSCDIPEDAALARVVAGIGARTVQNGSDPIGVLTSVVSSISQSVLYTGASFVNDHLGATSSGQLQINASGPTITDRLVQSANPNLKPDDIVTQALKAVTKIAGMGIGAAIAIGRDVLSPAGIAEIGTALIAGPEAALGVLATKLGGAVLKLIPPVAVGQVAKLAFNELTQGLIDNAGLVRMALDTSYWQNVRTTGYTTVPVGASGQSAVQLVADWVTTAAEDIAGVSAAAEQKADTTKPGPLATVPGQEVLSASEILSGQTN
ncbi:cutinase family protein [Nocardia sp. 004]|uniref:cutinase family protein n=1 Tax=Nocardia sp. 004 TaxID=3385978 RepID=UPI00399F8AF3